MIAQNSGIITLQLQVPELQIENTGTGEFKALNMDDAGFTAETGYPELPVFSTWIAIPPKGDIEVKVTSGDYIIKKGVVPKPVYINENQEATLEYNLSLIHISEPTRPY